MQTRIAGMALAIAAALGVCAADAQATLIELQRSFDDPDHVSSDLFGESLSLSGGTALVGAFNDGTNFSGSGQAYLYDAATGALLHTLANPTPAANDFFGVGVSLSGNRALIGAQNDDTSAINSGAAYLFDTATGGVLRTFLNPTPAVSDQFGHAVALSGNRALIAAEADQVGSARVAGSAYLFDTDTGALLQTFHSPTPALFDEFGTHVALFGDRALISAPFDDTGASNAGAAYLFDTTTGALLHTFTNPTPAVNDTFGDSVALSATRVLIGASQDDTKGDHEGAAYLYDLATGDLLATLLVPSPANPNDGDFFGSSAALSGDLALVGAVFDNHAARDSGGAYLFDANTGALLQEIFDAHPVNGEGFSQALALEGDTALIFAGVNEAGTTRVGSVRVYAPAALPEPSALALFGTSLLGLIVIGRRRERRR